MCPLLGRQVQRLWGEGMLDMAGALQEMRSPREDLQGRTSILPLVRAPPWAERQGLTKV